MSLCGGCISRHAISLRDLTLSSLIVGGLTRIFDCAHNLFSLLLLVDNLCFPRFFVRLE